MNSIEVEVGGKTYTINKFRATVGRKIVAQYPLTALPKTADYEQNEAVMLLLMSHVEVHLPDGGKLPLNTRALVDNHVLSWDDLVNIEYQTLKFNCPFMQNGAMTPLVEMIKNTAAKYLSEVMEQAIGSAISNQLFSGGGEEQ